MLILASLLLPPLGPLVDLTRVLFIATAANGLDDRDDIADALRAPLSASGATIVEIDLDATESLTSADLAGVSCVAVSGGDPFRLLAAVHRTGLDHALRSMGHVDYIGMSAGAAVAGPTLAPLLGLSPFAPAPNQRLDALSLVDVVTLAHDDRPGRRSLHVDAMRTHGDAHRLVALADHQVMLVRETSCTICDVQAHR